MRSHLLGLWLTVRSVAKGTGEILKSRFLSSVGGHWACNGLGRKSRSPLRASCWVDLNSQRFDAVAEASELPDHSRSACSFQSFACGLATFLVADPSVQDDPDQPTKAMGNGPMV